MKQYIPKSALRFFALLLCAAMLVPMIPAPVSAAQTAEQSVPVSQAEIDAILDYYSRGTVSDTMEYDCGSSLTGGGEKSYLTMVTDTTAAEFAAFQTKLKNAGYEVQRERTVASNSTAPNSFGSYLSPNGNYRVYTYHFPDYGETRIIVDTEERTVNGFTYEPQSGVNVEPKLVLWGLPMAPNGYNMGEEKSRTDMLNCGAMVVIRMPDNSLFIHDGGDVQQWNDEACDKFVEFCRELTGTSDGEKMVINTWFLSHAHSDHFRGFYRLINKKHDQFDLKNVVYNIDKERSGDTYDITGVMKLLRTVYPDVGYYKPHTGEVLDIAGVQVDVLYTLEDRFLPDSNGQLIIDEDNKGGTYRSGMYKKESTQTYDFNDTVTVVRVGFKNGVGSILYSDINKAANILTSVYPDSVLKTDIMMVPHHGHNELPALVNAADAKVYLYTQHKGGAYGPDDDVTTEDASDAYHSSLRKKFLSMFPGMNVSKNQTPNVDYDIFWAGTETVTIDINKLGNSEANYYTTQPAMSFEYTGWDVLDLYSDPMDPSGVSIGMSDLVTNAAVAVTNKNYRYDAVGTGELKTQTPYVIMHAATGNVMYYEAVAATPGTPNPATSIGEAEEEKIDSPATADYYFTKNDTRDSIYINHSIRSKVLWRIFQFNTDNKQNLLVMGAENAGNTYANNHALFGGIGYGSTWLVKGTSNNASYWTAVKGQDTVSPIPQFRFMDQRYPDGWLTNAEPKPDTGTTKKRYVVEDMGDGTYLVYWRSNKANLLCFLTCDGEGNWRVVEHNSGNEGVAVTVGKDELNSYRLKFLLYNAEDKSVQFAGPDVFYVTTEATSAQVLSYIQGNIKVVDANALNMVIPCSGDTAQIGYYYLKADDYAYGNGGRYQVSVLYRNDDGTDTLISSVTVNVLDRDLKVEGTTTHYVQKGVSEAEVRNTIADNITVTETLGNGYGQYSSTTVPYSAMPEVGKYWLEFSSEYGSHDYYSVKVNYRAADGSDIHVRSLNVFMDETVSSFTPPAANEENVVKGLVMVNSTLGTVVKDENGDDIAFTVNGANKMVSVGMLTKDGKLVDTSKAGTYEGLTLTYGGQVICENIILEVTQGDRVLDYPEKGEPGYVGVDKDGVTEEENFNGVADIQLSATGIPVERGVDMIVVMDLSGSMRYEVDRHVYADTFEGTRAYALVQSLKDMVNTLKASGADVRIAMSDFGDLDSFEITGSVVDETYAGRSVIDVNYDESRNVGYGEFANHLNYVMGQNEYLSYGKYDKDNKSIINKPFGTYFQKFEYAHSDYTGKLTPVVYTGSGKVDAAAFVNVKDLDMDTIAERLKQNAYALYGTNYDVGLEYAYNLGYAIQQDNIAKGQDRDIICVFMSDGAPMQYNYFTGSSSSQAWPAWITGRIDAAKLQDPSDEASKTQLAGYQAQLDIIEDTLLGLLKEGKLKRPEYQKDHLDGNVYLEKTDTTTVKCGTLENGYYLFREYLYRGGNDDVTFDDYMRTHEFYLDWDYLCEIARLNGIEDFDLEYYRKNQTCDALLDLFLDKSDICCYEKRDGVFYPVYRTKLRNPSLLEGTQFYTKYEGDSEDFYKAMKAIGVDCTPQMFARIAWANRTSLNNRAGSDATVDEYTNDWTKLMFDLRTVAEGYDYKTYSPYAHFYNEDGKNWWAEAIKGDTDKLYPVINKYAYEDSQVQPYTYYGDTREDYNGQKYMSGYRGLGIDMYTVSFSLAADNQITVADAQQVLQKISSNNGTTGGYYFSAASGEELTGVLKSITASMTHSASGAYFTDTMGDNYDLYYGQVADITEAPVIKVMEYALDENGDRGTLINTRETITFAYKNGTIEAYSDQIFTTGAVDGEDEGNGGEVLKTYPNIWDRETGLIRGKYVIYNTNTYVDETDTGSVDLYLDNSGRKFELKAETFFWVVGKLGETEMMLEYQVYLTGSHDDDKELAFARQYYDTNEQATLNYVNYLGNACWLPTKTPRYPWGGGAMEDVIVVDFGVPVEIDVLNNDKMFKDPTLYGINKGYEPTSSVENMDSLSFTTSGSVEGTYGSLKIEYDEQTKKNRLTYTLNTMEYDNVEEFTYAMRNQATNDTNYYFGKIKIIPATTIYYEEDFVTFKTHNRADGKELTTSVWTDSETQIGATQAQDRPGEDVNNALGNLDADNVYGYDGSYKEFSARSQGQAKVASVDANTYGTATFSFYGTGFDVISLSNRTTGTIVVSVYDYTEYENYQQSLKGTNPISKPTSKKDAIVDTYYGYKYENGNWVVDPTESDTLYQVPVIKMSDLPYGRYTAVITISYNEFFDHGQHGKGSYDFYLDAIRIYDPANDGNDDTVIKDAYIADDEGWPEYFELRNLLIKKDTFDSINDSDDTVSGIIFIDGFSALQNGDGNHTNESASGNLAEKSAVVKDYANFGPNNELYLAANQAVAFQLSIPGTESAKVASIQLALKSVGGAAYIKVYDADAENAANVVVPSATVDDHGGSMVSTATDLYYNITSLNNKTVVIANTGTSGILSITNIKVTYTAEHTNSINSGFFTTTTRAARTAIRSINDLFANVGEQDPGEVVNGTINIAGASLSFEDEILTNLYYTLSGVEATEMGLLTWSAEPADGNIDNAENVFVGAKYDAQKDRYMVQTSGIAAKNLGNTIYMRVYAKTAEGVVYSDLVTYSPKQYAMSRLEKSTNADMKALCVAMLNYGAAAQQYFGYKTDALMNAELTAEQKALASDYSADLFAGAVKADGAKIGAFTKTDGFAARSASVSFEGAFAINYYFAPNAKMNGDMTFYYWSAEDYANADVLTAENATGTSVMELTDNGSYWANITGIAAKQLDETFYVAAVYTDAAGNTHCTGVIAYSLSTYCMKNAVEGNAMKQLAEATAVYGYHANVYFGS